MAGFDHKTIDAKWQAIWERERTFATPTDRTRPKYYVLDMFPYPSGDGLHVGHPKGYTATDVVARAKRMMGFNVLHVMGWDSFGLPAERRAERTGELPSVITKRNIGVFKSQLQKLGLSYDWARELATSDPKYYKWTQWIFEVLYERGLAYRAEVAVNFCPALGTVLANEEVQNGRYIETDDEVERRLMKQWMLRITEYADRLSEDLRGLDWPGAPKRPGDEPGETYKAQLDWIGKSIGANVVFAVVGGGDRITVFTTRPDTLFGGTWVVLAPDHPLVDKIATPEQRAAIAQYREDVGKRSERDRTTEAADAPKTGVATGAFAINPVTGKHIPIWIADYVLASYGTGAVFACPAGDERDHAFARKFGLPIIEVVKPPAGAPSVQDKAWTGDGEHVNSGFLDGLDKAAAITRVIGWLAERNLGEESIRYKLRDWLFSRQRYWGEPFPLIHLADGTVKCVPKSELPVELPLIDEYKPTRDGQPPLARAKDWLVTTDTETGQPATRETNTMPQWAGSCWYYLRFLSPDRDDVAWDLEEEKYWMPVDLYVGGNEHAVLHLLYSRFWHKVLFDAGLVSTKEPFQRLFHQGMIHKTSFRELKGKYRHEHEVEKRDQLENRPATWTGSYTDNAGSWLILQQDDAHVFGTARIDGLALAVDGQVTGGFLAATTSSDKGAIQLGARRLETGALEITFANKTLTATLRPHVYYVKDTDTIVETKLDKMSKSRFNVVNPDDMCERHGADALRLYELFMGPLKDGVEWDDAGVNGTRKFLDRSWRLLVDPETDTLASKVSPDASTDNRELERVLHAAIKKVTAAVTDLELNTAISSMMVFVNEATKATAIPRPWFEAFVKILSPFAPHLAEEMWQRLGYTATIAFEPWPAHDEAKLVRAQIEIAVQVSGKVRGKIIVDADAPDQLVIELAKAHEDVKKYLEGKPIKMEKYVKGKLVTIAV